MVIEKVEITDDFERTLKRIKDPVLKEKVKKQTAKIINYPEIGKPMRYSRKGTRELHISPFRLSYAYFPEEKRLIFLELYHKDKQ
jgi:mRNA-degrading endonuclease RelE of RelBE toxin-antitoxin system